MEGTERGGEGLARVRLGFQEEGKNVTGEAGERGVRLTRKKMSGLQEDTTDCRGNRNTCTQ